MKDLGAISGSREPSPSSTGLIGSRFDPERICAEIRRIAERVDHYRDSHGDHIEFVADGAVSRALHELADVFGAIAMETRRAETGNTDSVAKP
jgi:hypothetical protein